MFKRIAITVFVATVAAFCFQLGGNVAAPGRVAIISSAEARIGRPLTPVSVAGVARRTARRCAVGVYSC